MMIAPGNTKHVSFFAFSYFPFFRYSKAMPTGGDSKKRDRVLKGDTPLPPPKEATIVRKKPKRMVQHTVSDEVVKSKASEIIMCLLFSVNRARRNGDAIVENKRIAIKARNTYITERMQQRQLPYLTDIYRLMGHITSRALPLDEYVFDEALHDYYVNVVLQVWLFIMKYCEKEYDAESDTEIIPRIDLETVVLGTLYVMRQGLLRGGMTLLPKDEFLLVSLPLIHEMSYFNNAFKKKITKGTTLLNDVYDNALGNGIHPQELCLDVSKLPEKNYTQVYRKLGH